MEGAYDEFVIEMGDVEVRQVAEWNRMERIETGGSVDTRALIYEGKVYFGSLNHNVYCLDARTGKLIWKYKTRDRIANASAVENNGKIFIGSYDKNMYALDAKTGKLVWKFKTEGIILSTGLIENDTLFFGSSDKNVYALDTATGSLKWKFRTYARIMCDPTISGDNVIIGSYDRNIYCLNRETGEKQWKLTTDREIVNVSGFPIKEGYIYVCSFDGILRKVDVNTGNVIWKRMMGQYGITCGPAILNDMLLVPSEDGFLYSLDFDGNVLWRFTTTKPMGTPALFNGKIYFTCEDFNFYCISLDGKLIWKFKTQEMVWWEPSFFEGCVYFSSYDCHLYVADAKTGHLVWKFRAEGSPSKYPPTYDQFEIEFKVKDSDIREQTEENRYDLKIDSDEGDVNFYKSRITYQVSTQYASKGGKYQVDTDEEGF